MSNKTYRCPQCNTEVTQQFVPDQGGRVARWWRCESGHFFGNPHWQGDWEEPTTAPPDPDLEPWIDEYTEGKRAAFGNGLNLVQERNANLTCWQFLGRAIPAIFFAALSIICVVRMLLEPYIQLHHTTLI